MSILIFEIFKVLMDEVSHLHNTFELLLSFLHRLVSLEKNLLSLWVHCDFSVLVTTHELLSLRPVLWLFIILAVECASAHLLRLLLLLNHFTFVKRVELLHASFLLSFTCAQATCSRLHSVVLSADLWLDRSWFDSFSLHRRLLI